MYSQSNGEQADRALRGALRALKGERTAEVGVTLYAELGVALNGESMAENAGEGGILSFPNLPVVGAEDGKTKAEVRGAAEVGDL